jgi:predicted ATPase
MSIDGISALERGYRRAPQRETVALLVGALNLDGEKRREFEAAAAGTRHRTIGASAGANGAAELPLPLTNFVGRETELNEIASLVGAHRLVTLTGTGGIGKTQLALRVGAAEDQSIVRFIPLATATKSSVAETIASVLRVRGSPNRPLPDALVTGLKNKSLLLILDNCEHVITEAATLVNNVLSGCRHIRILATSREPLKVSAERAYPVPPLGTEQAIALFADRAGAADYRFKLSDDNVSTVAEICRRVDGIPLAIELAAARVNTLSLRTLRDKLDERFQLLAGADRSAPPRQQTMYAAIDWGYSLLSDKEQRLFERLAIFVGSCTIEAAQCVTSDDTITESSIFEILSSLAEKSLIVPADDGIQTRYGFLESTQAFALDKLKVRGQFETFAQCHARWMAGRADEATATALTMPVEAWMHKFEPDRQNARVAFDWSLKHGDVSLAARIACGFAGVWRMNHGNEEPRRWLEALVSRIGDDSGGAVAANVWYNLSTVSFGIHSAEAAQRALALYHHEGEPDKKVAALHQMTAGFLQAGRIDEAEAANRRALELCTENGLAASRRYAAALTLRAHICAVKDRLDEARRYFAEALSLLTALGEEYESNIVRINMGELEYGCGQYERALEYADAAVAASRRVGSRHREASALVNAAAYRLTLRDLDGARANARDALLLSRWASAFEVAAAIQRLATVAALKGDPRRAARLRGYVDAWYRGEGLQRDMTELRTYDMLAEALGQRLNDDEMAALDDQGSRLSEPQAIAEALR